MDADGNRSFMVYRRLSAMIGGCFAFGELSMSFPLFFRFVRVALGKETTAHGPDLHLGKAVEDQIDAHESARHPGA